MPTTLTLTAGAQAAISPTSSAIDAATALWFTGAIRGDRLKTPGNNGTFRALWSAKGGVVEMQIGDNGTTSVVVTLVHYLAGPVVWSALKASIDATKLYTYKVGWKNGTQEVRVYDDTGTEIGTAGVDTIAHTLEVNGFGGLTYNGGGNGPSIADVETDWMAVWSDTAPAGAPTQPLTSATNLIEVWPLDEGSGATLTGAKSSLVLAITDGSGSHSWTVSGSVDHYTVTGAGGKTRVGIGSTLTLAVRAWADADEMTEITDLSTISDLAITSLDTAIATVDATSKAAPIVTGVSAELATIRVNGAGVTKDFTLDVLGTWFASFAATVTLGAVRTTYERPRLEVDFTRVTPTGTDVHLTDPADLSDAIWNNPDSAIYLPHGVSWADVQDVLVRKPPGHGWTEILTDGSLPPVGTIVTDAVSATYQLPQIVFAGTKSFVGSQVVGEIPYKIRFVGIDASLAAGVETFDEGYTGSVLNFNRGLTGKLKDTPHRIILDRCNMHVPDNSDCNSVVSLVGRHCGAIDTRMWGGHDGDTVRHSGQFADAKAFQVVDGPGPYTLRRCIVAATDEPIESGGSDSPFKHLITADFTMDQVYSPKPEAWRAGITCTPKQFKCNGLYEFKSAERVWAHHCIIDKTFKANQNGFGTQAWAVNQGGLMDWARCNNVETTDSWFRNVTSLNNASVQAIGSGGGESLLTIAQGLDNIVCTGFGDATAAGGADKCFTSAINPGSNDQTSDFTLYGLAEYRVKRITINVAATGSKLFFLSQGANYRGLQIRNSLIKLASGAAIMQNPYLGVDDAWTAMATGPDAAFTGNTVAGAASGAANRIRESDPTNHYVASFDSHLVDASTLTDINATAADLSNLVVSGIVGDDGITPPGADVASILSGGVAALAAQVGL